MFGAILAALQDEETRLIALRQWLLGNQLRRQVKMKISSAHGDSVAVCEGK